jgi:hypothetical protein
VEIRISRNGTPTALALYLVTNLIERTPFDHLSTLHEAQLRRLVEDMIKTLQDPTTWNAVMDPSTPLRARVLESTVETMGDDGKLRRRPDIESFMTAVTKERVRRLTAPPEEQPDPMPDDLIEELLRS